MSPAIDRLVRLMAEADVADYLAEEAAKQQAPDGARPNPVPLPDMDKAA